MPDDNDELNERRWWTLSEAHVRDITPTMAAQMTRAEIKEWREMTPERCRQCIAARCKMCLSLFVSHMSAEEVTRLGTQHGSLWPLDQLRYLGWQTEAGICPECYNTIRGVQVGLARSQTLDIRQ
jgi:hypothetical protein